MSRPGTASDAVDGIVPRTVVEPDTAEDAAATLAQASRDALSVVTRGSGTKLDWGGTPHAIDLLLSTRRLDAVLAHRHGDLTATVQAGATLASVNQQLAQHRQWIPLDPPWVDRATIGGLVATNDSGPRRHRYGAPRDLIIGVEFARTDGRLSHGGGIVVKNVAGYDLPRLMTGSFGSLAVITTVTFKLFPIAAASRTLAVELKTARELGDAITKVLGSHLTPTAVEFDTHPLRLLLRFESIDAAVERQVEAARMLLHGAGGAPEILSDADERQRWNQHGASIWNGDGAVLKVSALPSDIPGVLELLDSLAGASGYTATGRAGLGVFLVRVDGDTNGQARTIAGLRHALPLGRGSVVVLRGSTELKAQTDVWGEIGESLRLMRAVKRQFDPNGILNRGRAPWNAAAAV